MDSQAGARVPPWLLGNQNVGLSDLPCVFAQNGVPEQATKMSDSSKDFACLALACHNHLGIPHFSFRGTAKMSDSLCDFANHWM